MSIPLLAGINSVGREEYQSRPWPIVAISQCVDGTWFAMLSLASHPQSFQVRGCNSYRAAHAALGKKVRTLQKELAVMR